MRAICTLMCTLLFVHLVSTISCPENCHCQLERLSCRNASLILVPTELQTAATLIDFSFNNITIIYNHDLIDITDAEILFLNNNEITEVQPICFHQNKKLKHLYLNNNKIKTLDSEIFKLLTDLRYLSLKKNELEFLNSRIFQYNANLVVLDLGENYIKSLNPNIFEGNSFLSWVNLKNNPLPFSIQWKNLFNTSLNVIDFDFCKGHNTSIIELRAIQNLKKNNVTKQDSLYELEFPLISELVIAEDWNVLTPSGDTIFCYCEQISAWFWCYDTFSCHVTKREKYKMLNCSSQNSDILEYTENTAVDEKYKLHKFIYRTVNNNTLRNNVYLWIDPRMLSNTCGNCVRS
ncbi:hypothetical protein L9F63_007363 [Diploptera punctata]|uniref:Uncharacterized protein n=1 Tax=Diploptera punctata TaxID=6984 RepID=A0AAD7Z911_DIPPU|nr:hypothetical protein L9F63_007363 [Diploptera punctata]